MGNNFPDTTTLSDSQRALQTVKVDLKGLPAKTRENYLFRKGLLTKRRRNTRNALIYRSYLQADDKTQAVADLCERWSLSEKRIHGIITKQRDFGVEALAFKAEIEAIRQVRTGQVIADADEYWEYLQGYLYHLFDLKAGGETHVWVEETVTSERTDKNGDPIPDETKKKSIPVDEAIKRAYQLKAQASKMDADTLSQYIGKPNNTINVGDNSLVVIEANEEFKKQFDKLTGKKNEKEISADATVVDDSTGNAGD